MTDAPDPETTGDVTGGTIKLSANRSVTVGRFNHSKYWWLGFERDGNLTKLALSPEAMEAVIHLYHEQKDHVFQLSDGKWAEISYRIVNPTEKADPKGDVTAPNPT